LNQVDQHDNALIKKIISAKGGLNTRKVGAFFMALVARKKQGQSTQQLISEFKKLTYEDQGLERVKTVGMTGYQKPSTIRNVKMIELRKASARIRRRNKRAAGFTK